MDDFQIPSASQYQAAFNEILVSLPASHVRMLQAHCKAENRTLTARQLAEAAGYQSWRAVNVQYGTLDKRLRAILGFNAEGQASFVIAEFYKKDREKEWQWIMHKEVAEALHATKFA